MERGFVEGVGGRVKSLVRMKCMSKNEKVCVQTSMNFFNVLKPLMVSTTILHINNNEIKSKVGKEKPWLEVKKTPGIRKIHHVNASNGCLSFFKTSDSRSPDFQIKYIKRY